MGSGLSDIRQLSIINLFINRRVVIFSSIAGIFFYFYNTVTLTCLFVCHFFFNQNERNDNKGDHRIL